MGYFFMGAFLVAFILPLFENVSALITQIVEYLSMKFAVKTYLLKKQIQDSEDQGGSTNLIGFQLPSERDYYEDDQQEQEEEEYEDKKRSRKH